MKLKPQIMSVISFLAVVPSYVAGKSIDEAVGTIQQLDVTKKKEVTDTIDQGVFGTAQLMIFIIAVIAFLWVSYAAVSKFRECQTGRADWSELLVLGVAAGALLVFISLLISTAAGFLQQ